MMFGELPVAERFAAARKAGFRAVEYLAPYADPIAEVRRWIEDAGVEMILLNTLPGDAEAGDRRATERRHCRGRRLRTPPASAPA